MASRGYKTWSKRLDGWATGQHRPPLSEIYAFRNVMATADGFDKGLSLDMREAGELYERFDSMGPVAITDEQTRKGLDWTEKNRRKLEREGFPAGEVLEHFKRYTLVGFSDHSTSHRPDYTPRYGVELDDGRSLIYEATPWQDGACLEWSWTTGH